MVFNKKIADLKIFVLFIEAFLITEWEIFKHFLEADI
jgi:hypothetical protein